MLRQCSGIRLWFAVRHGKAIASNLLSGQRASPAAGGLVTGDNVEAKSWRRIPSHGVTSLMRRSAALPPRTAFFLQQARCQSTTTSTGSRASASSSCSRSGPFCLTQWLQEWDAQLLDVGHFDKAAELLEQAAVAVARREAGEEGSGAALHRTPPAEPFLRSLVREIPLEARRVTVWAFRLYARLGKLDRIRWLFTAAVQPLHTTDARAREDLPVVGAVPSSLVHVDIFNAYLEVMTIRRQYHRDEVLLVLQWMSRCGVTPNALTFHYLMEIHIRAGLHPEGLWRDMTRGHFAFPTAATSEVAQEGFSAKSSLPLSSALRWSVETPSDAKRGATPTNHRREERNEEEHFSWYANARRSAPSRCQEFRRHLPPHRRECSLSAPFLGRHPCPEPPRLSLSVLAPLTYPPLYSPHIRSNGVQRPQGRPSRSAVVGEASWSRGREGTAQSLSPTSSGGLQCLRSIRPLPATLQALVLRVVAASSQNTSSSSSSSSGTSARDVEETGSEVHSFQNDFPHTAFSVEVTRAALCYGGGTVTAAGSLAKRSHSSSGGTSNTGSRHSGKGGVSPPGAGSGNAVGGTSGMGLGCSHIVDKRQLVELVEHWLHVSSTASRTVRAATAKTDTSRSTSHSDPSDTPAANADEAATSKARASSTDHMAVPKCPFPPEYILWLILELEIRCVLDQANFVQFVQKRHVVGLLLYAAKSGDATTVTQVMALMDRHLMKRTADTGALAVWAYANALELEAAMETILWMAQKGYLENQANSPFFQRYTTIDTVQYTMDRHYLMCFVDALSTRDLVERCRSYLWEKRQRWQKKHSTASSCAPLPRSASTSPAPDGLAPPPPAPPAPPPLHSSATDPTKSSSNASTPSPSPLQTAPASSLGSHHSAVPADTFSSSSGLLISPHVLDLLVLAYSKLGCERDAMALVQSYEDTWGVAPRTNTLNALLMGLQLSLGRRRGLPTLSASAASAAFRSQSSNAAAGSSWGFAHGGTSLYHKDILIGLARQYPTIVPNALTYKLLIRQAVLCDHVDEAVGYLQLVGGGATPTDSSQLTATIPGPAGAVRVEIEMILPILERAARAGDGDTVCMLSQFALDCDIGIDAAVLQTTMAHLAKAGQSVDVLMGHQPLHEALRSRSKVGRQRARSSHIKL